MQMLDAVSWRLYFSYGLSGGSGSSGGGGGDEHGFIGWLSQDGLWGARVGKEVGSR